MVGHYLANKDSYWQKYHARSNVESTFSAIKAKFGDSVRSKTDVAKANEALCKILLHNLTCLIMSQVELGIEPVFWPNEQRQSTAVVHEPISTPVAPVVVDAVVIEESAPVAPAGRCFAFAGA
jgi:hypothetical protein